jgi:hypothetical protein
VSEVGVRSSARLSSRLVDAVIVLAISGFAAFASGSRTWAGFNSPDSEFYASLALFGNDVTDRSIDPAYTWTRLGYIAPVRGLVTVLGPSVGFTLWRFVLIVMIVAAIYAIVRMASTRELAIMISAAASLNTMVLSYVGNSYLTGTILAALTVLLALGVWGSLTDPRHPWLPPALSGLVAGWLVMLNPYALLLGMTMWVAVREVGLFTGPTSRWRALVRDAAAGISGFAVSFTLLLVAGLVIFPGRNWVQTYVDWNSQLDYSSFVGDPDVWQRDVALLVPVAALLVSVVAVAATRASRWAISALAVAAGNLAFTWIYLLLVPGPWLEAPHYVAKLWAGSLVALALAFAAIVGERRLGPAGWVTALLCVPLVLWSGRWDTTITGVQGLLILACVVGAFALAALALVKAPSAVAAIVLVTALGGTAVAAQILQNGRGPLGIYGQYPFRAAYVDFEGDLLMSSKIAAEEWVLDHTAASDRIGVWTDPERLTSAVAAMQLWGKYNNVSGGATLTKEEADNLEELAPTALALYAPTRGQIDAFLASLPPWSLPTAPECTSVPYRGIGSSDAHVCVTHLRWAG